MQLFLYILLVLDCLACLASTSPTGEPEYPIVNSTHYAPVRRDKHGLYHILEDSWDAGEMLEGGQESDRIAMVSAKFDDIDPWSITCYNSQTATVITLITSQGGIIVKIPGSRLEISVSTHGNLNPEYDSKIHQPVFGGNGFITRRLLEWQKDSGGWWPDALQIIVSTPGTANSVKVPKFATGVHQIEEDLRNLWSFEINPRTGERQEPGVQVRNILDGERMTRTTFRGRVNIEAGWENHNDKAAQYGYAIQWERTATMSKYRTWIGHKSRTKLYPPDHGSHGYLDRHLVKSDNGRGWYPTTVQPLGVEPPGQGCIYEDTGC